MTELNVVLQETLQETLARRDIRLVLASASPRRRELFHQAGLFPEIIPSHKEERSAAKTPAALVKALCWGDGRQGSISGFVTLDEADCAKIYQLMVR